MIEKGDDVREKLSKAKDVLGIIESDEREFPELNFPRESFAKARPEEAKQDKKPINEFNATDDGRSYFDILLE